MNVTTIIRGGAIVAHDGKEHRLLRDGVVVVRDDRILHVGKSWEGVADRVIDARRKTVIPGMISSHAHIGAYEGARVLIDVGMKKYLRTGFLHFMPARRSTGKTFSAPSDRLASLEQGFASLLRHGITTVVDYFEPSTFEDAELMAELAGRFGIRLYWSPAISGGRYWLEENGQVSLELDDRRGAEGLEMARRFLDQYDGAHDGRLRGAVIIDEFYASTPHLRKEAKALARERGLVFTMHFLEQHREFFEVMGRTGLTPVQLIEEEGLLDRQTLLAHCIYLANHSLVGYPVADDIEILGRHGVSVAHSPANFARRGVVMESFDRYRAAGINVSLATDMFPLEMFNEMRTAATGSKIAERNNLLGRCEDVFHAATLAGAAALGRDDLGRLSAGAKADIVVVDTDNLQVGYNPDPLRALVHFGSANMVDTVIVDGRVLVERGELLVCDEADIRSRVETSSDKVWAGYPQYHPDAVNLTAHFPPSIKNWVE